VSVFSFLVSFFFVLVSLGRIFDGESLSPYHMCNTAVLLIFPTPTHISDNSSQFTSYRLLSISTLLTQYFTIQSTQQCFLRTRRACRTSFCTYSRLAARRPPSPYIIFIVAIIICLESKYPSFRRRGYRSARVCTRKAPGREARRRNRHQPRPSRICEAEWLR
jgi:hypothetical protein